MRLPVVYPRHSEAQLKSFEKLNQALKKCVKLGSEVDPLLPLAEEVTKREEETQRLIYEKESFEAYLKMKDQEEKKSFDFLPPFPPFSEFEKNCKFKSADEAFNELDKQDPATNTIFDWKMSLTLKPSNVEANENAFKGYKIEDVVNEQPPLKIIFGEKIECTDDYKKVAGIKPRSSEGLYKKSKSMPSEFKTLAGITN